MVDSTQLASSLYRQCLRIRDSYARHDRPRTTILRANVMAYDSYHVGLGAVRHLDQLDHGPPDSEIRSSDPRAPPGRVLRRPDTIGLSLASQQRRLRI